MQYNTRYYPEKVKRRIQRRKRTRYHNDTAFFPDDGLGFDRKRRRSLKLRQRQLDKIDMKEMYIWY